MYDRMIVPLDGSQLAEQVLPYVHVVSEGLKCPITLVRVFDVPAMIEGVSGATIDRVANELRADADRYLERVKGTLVDVGTDVSVVGKQGDAASVIIEEAEKESSTIVMISSHGRSGVTRWAMGSVAEKVLQATNNPLLIIRDQAAEGSSLIEGDRNLEDWNALLTVKNIIVTLDGSSISEQVIPHAMAFAKSLAVPLTPVRVSNSPNDDSENTEYLNNVVKRFRDENLQCDGGEVLHGNPATAIIEVAEQIPNSLVAMTTRGRSGIQRWVMGSVTDRVVRHSGSPALVIRGT